MKLTLLLGYQLLTGLSDTATGVLLIFAPAWTLHLMRLQPVGAATPFLSWIGAFVLSVGLACLYGAMLTSDRAMPAKLSVVWLLTGITRALVAVFVLSQIATGSLESGWISVALTDGTLALLQFAGLATGWLARVER